MKNQLGYYGGLGSVWGDVNEAVKYVTAQQMIPKKHPIYNADQASDLLAEMSEAAPPPKPQAKGDVYWTPSGPKFSKTDVPEGKKMAYVKPPQLQSGPFVKMIRDLPKLKLNPIKIKVPVQKKDLQGLSGLTDAGPVSWVILLAVLGLIFLGLRHYNMAL